MFTIKQIKNGSGYLARHLSANDYYHEGETVTGTWIGKGADMLGLDGVVKEADFVSITENRHPSTGEKLTPRRPKNSLHDIGFGAPKAVSILGIVGGDERVVEAFNQSMELAQRRLEEHAAVRIRDGSNYRTENVRFTRNMTSAVFIHDANRSLDPHLHAHFVTGNFSWCDNRERHFALQTRQMMEVANRDILPEIHQDLAQRIENLGYKVRLGGGRFSIDGIPVELEEKFSTRARQRKAFEKRYLATFGEQPSKKRIEHFIREGKSAARSRFEAEYQQKYGQPPAPEQMERFVVDWRSAKLARISTEEVRKLQMERLSQYERIRLEKLVEEAISNTLMRATETQELEGDPKVEDASESIDQNRERARDREQELHGVEAKQQRRKPAPEKTVKSADGGGTKQALRDLKRGAALQAALRGHPAAAIIYAARRRRVSRSR